MFEIFQKAEQNTAQITQVTPYGTLGTRNVGSQPGSTEPGAPGGGEGTGVWTHGVNRNATNHGNAAGEAGRRPRVEAAAARPSRGSKQAGRPLPTPGTHVVLPIVS